MRPCFAVIALNDSRHTKNNVLRKRNPVNFCINYLLIRSKGTARQIDQHKLMVYKTHMKKSCRYISETASYIFVLSIIPPQ